MIKILEEKLEGTLLTVTVEAKLRVTVEEKIKFFESGDVIKLLGEKYEVSGVIKNNRLSNSLRAGGKQKGSWIFVSGPGSAQTGIEEKAIFVRKMAFSSLP